MVPSGVEHPHPGCRWPTPLPRCNYCADSPERKMLAAKAFSGILLVERSLLAARFWDAPVAKSNDLLRCVADWRTPLTRISRNVQAISRRRPIIYCELIMVNC